MTAGKKVSKEDREKTHLVTPKFRVSYPHVFKAQAPKGSNKLKYSVMMLFPKDTDLTSLKKAIVAAKIAKWGDKEDWPDGILSPVNDGDSPKYAGKEGYKGHWAIKATSNEDSRPQVVDQNVQPIINTSEFYAGCYARAYISAFAWEYMGKVGVSFSFDHVQKLADGKSFSGRKAVEEVFQPVRDEESDETEIADENSF